MTVTLTVNGAPATLEVPPRTSLADALRDELLLTGTHLGCEHGVCGACTVLIDGEPARACITFAAAVDGAEVTTIEGLDDDSVAAALREAFTAEHGLQCGYCTPGMLITARDLVLRLPEADAQAVRVGLSGNLCRCTGYRGIVRAVCRVIEARATARAPVSERRLGPVGSGHAGAVTSVPTASTAALAAEAPPIGIAADFRPTLEVARSFVVPFPRARVWTAFADVAAMAACLPGAALTAPPRDGQLAGEVRVKLGPITAAFAGEGTMVCDDARFEGRIRGAGRDRGGGSQMVGELRYALHEAEGGAATRIEVTLAAALTGPLAQFGRGAIVEDLAARLAAEFAENLEAHLRGEAAPAPARLEAGGLVFSVLWARLKAWLASLFG